MSYVLRAHLMFSAYLIIYRCFMYTTIDVSCTHRDVTDCPLKHQIGAPVEY